MLLVASGARVFVEGDPAGANAPLVDLACTATDDEAARALGETLDGYLAAPTSLHLRPPWHPAGVTVEQTRARVTLVAIERAIGRALRDPHVYDSLRERAYQGLDPAEVRRLLDEIHREKSLEALEHVERGPHADRDVVAEIRRTVLAGPIARDTGFHVWAQDLGLRRRLAERLGSLSLEVSASGAPGGAARLAPSASDLAHGATGRVQVEGRRVSLGGLAFHRFARGLPGLLAQLAAAKCTDARLALVEAKAGIRFDDSEGD